MPQIVQVQQQTCPHCSAPFPVTSPRCPRCGFNVQQLHQAAAAQMAANRFAPAGDITLAWIASIGRRIFCFITVAWSLICGAFAAAGVSNVIPRMIGGQTPDGPYATAGAVIGMNVGAGMWFLLWGCIAGPSTVLWWICDKASKDA